MTRRERQRELDRLAMRYLHAIEHEQWDVIDEMWDDLDMPPDVSEMLYALHEALVDIQHAAAMR